MTRMMKLALPIVAGVMLSASLAPAAHAQFAGGGFEQMQQMAPMLNMMKKKMGKKRFGMLMRTMGPMMSNMMSGQGGGFGGGGFGGGSGFNMSAMSGMMNPEMISGMIGMAGGRGGF